MIGRKISSKTADSRSSSNKQRVKKTKVFCQRAKNLIHSVWNLFLLNFQKNLFLISILFSNYGCWITHEFVWDGTGRVFDSMALRNGYLRNWEKSLLELDVYYGSRSGSGICATGKFCGLMSIISSNHCFVILSIWILRY